jgi:hypothetical protein
MIEKDFDEMFRTTNPDAVFNPINNTEKAILDECNRIANLLIEKNRAYGNSALEPARIFSSSNNVEQLNVRIDDKLSRRMLGGEYKGDNDLDDLIGYLLLLSIAKKETWK